MPIEIRMPELSADMVEADLVSWLVETGDRIEIGDLLAEVETDKATVELEADTAGVLLEIRVAAGTTGVKVGEVLAVIDAEAAGQAPDAPGVPPESAAAVRTSPTASRAPATTDTSQSATTDAETSDTAASLPDTGAPRGATALAKRIARQEGVELAGLDGSGPGGKIVKRDVESALSGSSVAAPEDRTPTKPAVDPLVVDDADFDAPFTSVPHRRMRRTIATRLTQAKQTIPHFYLRAECHLDRMLAVRRELNQTPDVAVSVNDFVIRAIALALRAVPLAHVAWREDATLRFERADISVAVATDNGLVTPVVRGADRKGLATIAREMRDLAGRAREGKLRPEEYRGGTFTVSNLGMFGVESVTPILNPPQSGILGVGAGVQRPVARDGEVAVATVMVVTLAADHRALDGASGARLLAAFKARIEEPLEMIL